MLINEANLTHLLTGLNGAFQAGLQEADPQWERMTTRIPTRRRTVELHWLGKVPLIRQWIGDKHIGGLDNYVHTLDHKAWESTLELDRHDLEDYESAEEAIVSQAAISREFGMEAAMFPDREIFDILKDNTAKTYDGKVLFADNHTVKPKGGPSVSNQDTSGGGEYWYLLSTKRAIKPFFMVEREAIRTVSHIRRDTDRNFMARQIFWGLEGRVGFHPGMWQLSARSNQALDEEHVDELVDKMTAIVTEKGDPINLMPDTIVVGRSNRAAAEKLFEVQREAGGADNRYYRRFDVVFSARLP